MGVDTMPRGPVATQARAKAHAKTRGERPSMTRLRSCHGCRDRAIQADAERKTAATAKASTAAAAGPPPRVRRAKATVDVYDQNSYFKLRAAESNRRPRPVPARVHGDGNAYMYVADGTVALCGARPGMEGVVVTLHPWS